MKFCFSGLAGVGVRRQGYGKIIDGKIIKGKMINVSVGGEINGTVESVYRVINDGIFRVMIESTSPEHLEHAEKLLKPCETP